MEDKASFDSKHYPDGVNANFLTSDDKMLEEKYAGKWWSDIISWLW